MKLTFKSLEEIAKENEVVVVDTCVLAVKSEDSELRHEYDEYIKKVLADGIRLHISPGVKKEIGKLREKGIYMPDLPLDVHKSRYFERVSPKIIEYLKPKALRLGVIDNLHATSTDLGLAALAFALAHNKSSVGFVSSDRNLCALVYSTILDLKDNQKNFPCTVEGIINVYSFMNRYGSFVPYEDELDLIARRKAI